jgi:hypothetical protein
LREKKALVKWRKRIRAELLLRAFIAELNLHIIQLVNLSLKTKRKLLVTIALNSIKFAFIDMIESKRKLA